MKRKSLLLIVSILILSLTACGETESTEVEVSANMTEEVSTPTEQPSANKDAEAMAIIENARAYNATDNLFSWEDYADNRATLFVSEDNSDGYAVILEELEEKTSSAQEQITSFYSNISVLFPSGSELYDQANQISQVCYYYQNIAVNPSWAMEDIYFHAMVSGGNEVSSENGWTPPTFASGETVYMADAIMYAPSYLKKCSDENTTPTMEDMVNQMCSMTREECGLTAIRSLNESDGNYDNEVYNDYQYAYASLYVPYYDTMYNMGVMYNDFSNLAEHELYFSAPITVSEEYCSYDYTTGTMKSAYIIPFYDKTDNVYGEGVFDANNNLVGISFADEDIAAKIIILYASSFNTTDNLYDDDILEDDIDKLFLSEENSMGYSFILDDLSQKTNCAYNDVINLYSNLESIFSEDNEILDYIEEYYRTVVYHPEDAQANLDMYVGRDFADGEEILARHLIAYIPYYLSTPANDKIYTMDAILDELSSMNESDTILAGLEDYSVDTLFEAIPLYDTILGIAMFSDDLSNLNVEFIFSPPIAVTDNYWYFDHINGRVESAYVVICYNKTDNTYCEVSFTEDNRIIEIYQLFK